MPQNILLTLSESEINHIEAGNSGTERVARLFRATAGRLVNRNSVATVALQLDHQKRVRRNGGARDKVLPEGYLIMSGTYHATVAEELGLPVPSHAEYIAARVTPSEDSTGSFLEGAWWRLAEPDELTHLPAPLLPDEEKRKKHR